MWLCCCSWLLLPRGVFCRRHDGAFVRQQTAAAASLVVVIRMTELILA